MVQEHDSKVAAALLPQKQREQGLAVETHLRHIIEPDLPPVAPPNGKKSQEASQEMGRKKSKNKIDEKKIK